MSYATPTDLGNLSAIPADVLAALPSGVAQAALDATDRLIDGYLTDRFTLPLVTWGDDLKQVACDLTAYKLMSRLGYDPNGSNEDFRLRYQDGIRWLEAVAKGVVTPAVVQTSPVAEPLAWVVSSTPRGW